MKIKEIEQAIADGTPLAYAHHTLKGESLGQARAVEAIPLAVRQERRVYSSARWDWGGHTAHDGIRVRVMPSGDEEVISGKKLIATWAEYCTAKAAYEAKRTQEQSSANTTKAQAEQARDHLNARYGYSTARVQPVRTKISNWEHRTTGYEVVVQPATMLAILDELQSQVD